MSNVLLMKFCQFHCANLQKKTATVELTAPNDGFLFYDS